MTITWIASSDIFNREEGCEVIHYPNLVTVPKFGHRKRDGAPLNFTLHPVLIKQYNNLYFLFFLYISHKLKQASLMNNPVDEYNIANEYDLAN